MNIKELKEKLLSVGFTEEVLSGIQEDKLQGLIDSLEPKELSFDDFLKDPKQQGEFDRRVTKAIEKVKSKSEKKDDPKPEIKPNGDQPEWANAFLENQKALMQEIETLKAGAVTKSKIEQAKEFISKTKLPDNLKESWLTRIDINSDTPLNQQAESLEKEYNDLVQGIADGKITGGPPPKGSQPNSGMSKEELKKALV